MGTRTKRYQGGAIISFIIVTVVIAALLVGGIMWLRHRGSAVREGQLAAQSESTKAPEGVSNEGRDSSNNGAGANNTGNSSGSQSDKTSDNKETKPSANSQSNTATSQGSTSTAKTPSGQSQGEPGTLPQTGPADAAVAAAILGLITYTAVRFALSQRERIRVDAAHS